MSYLLWQRRDRTVGIGAARVVLRAAEVPLIADAQTLRDRLEQLNQEAAQRIEAAEQDARVQGYVQGREQAAREAQDEVAATLVALERKAAQEREQVRAEIAALALQVARKMLGQLPAEDVLAALAANAARDVLNAPTLTLIVHHADCDAVRTRLAAIVDADPSLPRFEVQPDDAVAPGTCRIETALGTVDASLDAQLTRIAAAWGVA